MFIAYFNLLVNVNTEGSDTLVWSTCIRRLFIYFNFLLECLWSAKMLRIEGQLAFIKPHLFGHFIFYQEPVLDKTMTNLQQNTISLKILDFNRILF